MGKYLLWAALIIISVVIFVLAFNFIREEAQPLVKSPSKIAQEFYQAEQDTLGADDLVIVSMENSRYHRENCPKIVGVTEKITLAMAQERDLEPCPFCLNRREE